jgi:hypothetical protein
MLAEEVDSCLRLLEVLSSSQPHRCHLADETVRGNTARFQQLGFVFVLTISLSTA